MNFLIRGSERLAQQPNFKLISRDAELERLTSILLRDRASSVILVGQGGVGCSSLCLGIQEAKANPDTPFDIIAKRLLWLDTNELFALGDAERISKEFRRILDRIDRIGSAVLLIDDALDFISSCRNAGTSYIINALMAAISRGHLQVILETGDDDLEEIFKCHSDIYELFTVMILDEPTNDALRAIVGAASKSLSNHHRIKVSDKAIDTAIDLTTKYRLASMRSQPERSITLLDRALAAYRLHQHRRPPGYDDKSWSVDRERLQRLREGQRHAEELMTQFEDELQQIIDNGQGNPLHAFEPAEASDLRKKIKMAKAEADEAGADFRRITDAINNKLELTSDIVLEEFADISGIPASKLNENESEKLKGLETSLASRIYGQEEAVRKLANGVKVARVRQRSSGRPLAYLFMGPSGTGKTELSKALAFTLLGDENLLTRFDMSEYMEKHAVAKMIGAPPGYEGFDVGGVLTNLMRKNGYRVLLFDEIEKAHPDVFNIFLQVLGDGRLTDNIGRTVSFADSIIIMTTNTGQAHFLNDDFQAAESAAMEELNDVYRSEFLNRFAGRQNIICFKCLDLDSIGRITVRELASLSAAYGDRSVALHVSSPTIKTFCEARYDRRTGARGLPGLISTSLEPDIVNAVLESRTGTGEIVYDDKEQTLKVVWQ